MPAPASTTAPAPIAPTSTPPAEGELVVVDYANGTPVATQTIVTTGITGTVTSSVEVSSSSPSPSTPSVTPVGTSPSVTPVGTPSATPSVIPTAAAGKLMTGLAWLYPAFAVAALLL
jgi:hypothetical protein